MEKNINLYLALCWIVWLISDPLIISISVDTRIPNCNRLCMEMGNVNLSLLEVPISDRIQARTYMDVFEKLKRLFQTEAEV